MTCSASGASGAGCSQLDLAIQADISARHLSFVETGRSRPTSAMILRLTEHLDVPLRDRNTLLLAGGYAPAYPEHRLDGPELAAVRTALRAVLTGHEPYPAVVVNHWWELLDCNTTIGVLTEPVAAHLLAPPVNVLRLSLHPEGMAPHIVNLAEWRAHLLGRLRRQLAATGDVRLAGLFEELRGYPGGEPGEARAGRCRGAAAVPAGRPGTGLLQHDGGRGDAHGRDDRGTGDRVVLPGGWGNGGGSVGWTQAGCRGFALLAASTLGLLLLGPATPLWVTTALLCGRGAVLGLTVQPLVMALLDGSPALPASAMPDANTLFNMAERLSGSFGIALLATLYASRAAATGDPVAALHDCALVLTAAAAVGAVAAACNHGVSASDAGSAQGGRHGRRHLSAVASQRADQAVPTGER